MLCHRSQPSRYLDNAKAKEGTVCVHVRDRLSFLDFLFLSAQNRVTLAKGRVDASHEWRWGLDVYRLREIHPVIGRRIANRNQLNGYRKEGSRADLQDPRFYPVQ